MKFRLSLLLCFLFLSFFGQEKVFYFKDANKEYSSKTIGSANFKEVVDDIVLESITSKEEIEQLKTTLGSKDEDNETGLYQDLKSLSTIYNTAKKAHNDAENSLKIVLDIH